MDSVSKVEQWMRRNTTQSGLQHMLVSYLRERGTVQMSDLLPHSAQRLSCLAENGWQKWERKR